MIIPDHGQHKFIEEIVNSFFGDVKTQTLINHNRDCLTIIAASQDRQIKLRKIKTYVDLEFYKSGLVNTVTVRGIDIVNRYTFTPQGVLEQENYRTIDPTTGKNHIGRKSDGLYFRCYDAHSIVCEELYVNPITGVTHNTKGHARLFKPNGKTTVKQYYLNGIHVGDDLPVGDDPETFLKNYLMLK